MPYSPAHVVPRFLSPAEAEIYSGLSRATLYRLIAAGILESRKVGRRCLIPVEALDRLGIAPDAA